MTSLTILKENLTWETFLVELSRARAKGAQLVTNLVTFAWAPFHSIKTSGFIFRPLPVPNGTFFAPECLKFLVEWFAFRKSFRSLGPFPGKYFTNCRCFQSFLSFGWMESAQNASKKFWFWENRLHVLLTMCKSMCCTCKLDVQTLALLITSG